ncbi:3-methylornithine--L-lysine ligase PylC [Zhaonella formicivorans]|uniref:3-methylornithine--L-lysine ligase PylC n=1 Tax=Zhaonella formicivorans TaxID=2528593 RepID=UPI0010E93B51|nr:3-methylornithine--L-lysine ligase PylC [Zhaonella formicivorans]
MRVAIIGGRLQGVEAAYLAKKAGWKVTLLDKDSSVPAMGLCDTFYCLDVGCHKELKAVLKGVDFIIPALENKQGLEGISQVAKEVDIPLAFDAHAYAISSSKIESNKLFKDIGIPIPCLWPECAFPVIVKPSGASGSQGVCYIKNSQELSRLLDDLGGTSNDLVIQEFSDGPSFSIEVLGFQGTYQALQVTELEMDAKYDCKRVLAPALLSEDLRRQFEHLAVLIAGALNLNGIMDVEVILQQGQFQVLEIDARLPSQTPTAVYKSSGVNMLQLLGKMFTEGQPVELLKVEEAKGTVYEHIWITPDKLEVCGEHIMSEAGPLQLRDDFFGADEAITNYLPGKDAWVATLIVTGENRREAWEKRCEVIARISKELRLGRYVDPSPQF